MSAASIAAPTPVPIAIPRSAWASAAASFTPSPTIPTRCPSRCSRAISSSLPLGVTSRQHALDADRPCDGMRGARIVAGQQLHVDPHPAQARDRLARLGLDRVGQGDRADDPPARVRAGVGGCVLFRVRGKEGVGWVFVFGVHGKGVFGGLRFRSTPQGVCARGRCVRSRSRCGRRTPSARARPELGRALQLLRAADPHLDAVHERAHARAQAWSGTRSPARLQSLARARRRPRPAATGCSEPASALAASASTRSDCPRPARAQTSATDSSPVVTVPVLSSTIVSSSWLRSRISPLRISSPRLAPRPVPTRIATGVARPSAQGQATISTAIVASMPRCRCIEANMPCRSWPVRTQPSKRERGEHEHAGHEVACDRIGEALDLRLGGLRALDERDQLRERGVGADRASRARAAPRRRSASRR